MRKLTFRSESIGEDGNVLHAQSHEIFDDGWAKPELLLMHIQAFLQAQGHDFDGKILTAQDINFDEFGC